jgi:hypothetical protein
MTDTTSKIATAPTIAVTRPILKMNSFKKANEADHAVEKTKTTLALKIPKSPTSLPKIDKQVETSKTAPIVPSKQEPKQEPKQELKKSKPKRFIDHKDFLVILKYLKEHFPKCFLETKVPLPLAIGIDQQILTIPDLPFSKTVIRKFLSKYTGSFIYRKQLIIGSERINLDGSVASKVLEMEVPKWQYDQKANQNQKLEKDKEHKTQQT